MSHADNLPVVIEPTNMLGEINMLDLQSPLVDGAWYELYGPDDGFAYRFAPGTLAKGSYLTCDLLLEGTQAGVLGIHLQEGENGPHYVCHFGLLNQCQARVRLPLSSVQQNRWMYPREGAWLKVITSGDIVDLTKVDRMVFRYWRGGDQPLRLCVTPMILTDEEPEKLTEPLLPAGPLLDEFGQTTLVDWPGKTKNETELVSRLHQQRDAAGKQHWPDNFTKYGGWKQLRFEATGYFRTHHDGQRWWLVDPQGYAFWSAGLDCVRSQIEGNINQLESALKWLPTAEDGYGEALNERGGQAIADYLRTNLMRAFGKDHWEAQWEIIALSMLRQFGFNTVANWSDWEIARKAGFPYVRPLEWPAKDGPRVARVFRDFPDVFDPAFAQEAAHYAKQLLETRDDPALIGYFLMNEPQWGFAEMVPAQGMLYNSDGGHARDALAAFLQDRYETEQAFQEAWGESASFAMVAQGRWTRPISGPAQADLEAFSSVMVEKLYGMLNAACRAADPNHLNLGARYYRVPPDWAMKGMSHFDVFSVNCYRDKVDRSLAEACEAMGCPALVGEWHFGALDVGLPASGIGRVATQADRGRAYRVYVEDAAAQPWCVGVHYFTLYDQNAIGRFDGENYNIGFIDICHQPYKAMVEAARAGHERIYDVAAGQAAAYDDGPEQLERLFY